MLDRIMGFGLVAMLLIGPSKPNIGFLLLRIEGHGFLKTLDGFVNVSAAFPKPARVSSGKRQVSFVPKAIAPVGK